MTELPLLHQMTLGDRLLITDFISVLILYFHTLTYFAVIVNYLFALEYLTMSRLPLRHEMTHGGRRLITDIILSVLSVIICYFHTLTYFAVIGN